MDKNSLIQYLTKTRRALHAMPELSNCEYKTSQFLADELKSMGISYKTYGNAIVADIPGIQKDKKIVAFRADMDALPITETGARAIADGYASKNNGVMHACGHDGHMTMLLGLAKVLSVEPPKSNARLIFQPAEERGGGAEELIAKGALKGVEQIFGLHLSPDYEAGKIAVSPGAILAGAVDFSVSFAGRSAHCAQPEKAIDALKSAVMFYNRFYELASKYKNILVNIGKFASGTKGNIIASDASMEVTFRYYDEAVKEEFFVRIQEILNDIYNTIGSEHCVTIDDNYPPVVNSPALAQAVAKKFDNVVPANPVYTAEDFAFYLKKVPGVFGWLGVNSGKGYGGLHTPDFDFEEEILLAGVEYFVAISNNILVE